MPQIVSSQVLRGACNILVLSITLSASIQGQVITQCPPGCGPGKWSATAIDLSSSKDKAPYKSRDIQIESPDHQKVARFVRDQWWIEIGRQKISTRLKDSSILYPAEFSWAPDSKGFYITYSVGYSTGYHTDIYRLGINELVLNLRINRIIQRDFDRHHKCFDGQTGNDPNVAGLTWLEGSNQILIVAEVPPIGVCKQMEYFGGYRITTSSGEILERYSPQQLLEKWEESLGERLKSNLHYLSPGDRTTKP